MSEIRTSSDLQAYLDAKAIEAEIVFLTAEVPTVPAAALAAGVRPKQIAKSILFVIKGEDPVLVITSGTTRVDRKRLAAYLQRSRKRVRLANADQVRDLLGYQVGTVPPFGHSSQVRTLLEQNVMDQKVIYAGGGDRTALIRLRVAELQRALPDAEIVSLTAAEEAGSGSSA